MHVVGIIIGILFVYAVYQTIGAKQFMLVIGTLLLAFLVYGYQNSRPKEVTQQTQCESRNGYDAHSTREDPVIFCN